MRLFTELIQVALGNFRNAGFGTCILKGVGTAMLYPCPLRRQCGDIDLWTDGGRRDVMEWLSSNYRVGEVRWHHTDVKIFVDVLTEFHFHATWLFNPWRNKKLQRFLDQS